MPKDIQIYCDCMERVRHHVSVADTVFAGKIDTGIADLSAPVEVFRAMFAEKRRQRVQGSESLVTCRDAAVPVALKVCEELTHQSRADIHDSQAINRYDGRRCDKRQQQAEDSGWQLYRSRSIQPRW